MTTTKIKPTKRQAQLDSIVRNSELQADEISYDILPSWRNFIKSYDTATKEQIDLVKKAIKNLENAKKVFRKLCVISYDEWNELYKENQYW